MLRRLWQTPLLLGWLIVGPLIALFTEGWIGLAFGLINVALLGFWAVLIRLMTPDPPRLAQIKRPRLELGIALTLFVIFMLTQLLDFGVWTVQPWYRWVRNSFAGLYRFTAGINGIH